MASLLNWAILQSPRLVRFFMNRYAPLRGAGIRVTEVAPDFKRMVLELPLTAGNRNIMGTQFGGSLYAMADPFFVLMLMRNLGRRYLVWDQAATVEFVAPGKGRVRGVYEISDEALNDIERQAASGQKVLHTFNATIAHVSDGTPVARVQKVIYVRLRKEFRPHQDVSAQANAESEGPTS
jgi:acyl-coenzyme A thioesterase PaaI-like protein